MAAIALESGVSFDPKVVEVLQENYAQWEKLAWANEPAGHRLSKDVACARTAPRRRPDCRRAIRTSRSS